MNNIYCPDSELNLSGEETVFLDDIGANLKAANKLGIQTIKVGTIELNYTSYII